MAGKKDAIGDATKPRLSLIPKEALWAMGGALTYGETHYGSHNWREGIKLSILLDAALRHVNEFIAGEDIDQKSQNHHLGNAMANLAMAISLQQNKPEMDDRYKAYNSTDDDDLQENVYIMTKSVPDNYLNDGAFLIHNSCEIINTPNGGLDYVKIKTSGPGTIVTLKEALDLGLVKKNG